MTEKTKRRSIVGAGATLLVSFVAISGVNAVFTVQAVQQSEQQLCDVIQVGMIPRPTPPADPDRGPSTGYGKDLQRYTQEQAAIDAAGRSAMRRLASNVECPSGR